MRFVLIILIILILSGCQNNTYIEGPELIEGNIRNLTIESLENGANSAVIKDHASIKTVEYLFSKYRWERNNGRKLTPSYKFTIITKDDKQINYWVGAYSDLNEFPCYRLCSGWWVIASDNENKMNGNIYKSISNSSQMYELALLLDNVENQPNKGPNRR
ncbi:MAG: hypothetical protein OEZ39_02075 [Gammaproteobacteria bacterium]|nr:hypothetical protein [Gammaproteobacteria bacterium]MDH5650642.1 hypothetical protein [Gammaproteobacteria bacterium]